MIIIANRILDGTCSYENCHHCRPHSEAEAEIEGWSCYEVRCTIFNKICKCVECPEEVQVIYKL